MVEYVVYRPYDPRATRDDEESGAPRYLAYVLRSGAAPTWLDIGDAARIDAEVGELRDHLANPYSDARRTQELARSVERRLMEPVRKAVGSTRHLIVSPDGSLHLLPFGALADPQGRLLVDRYTFTYLSTGRDLLRVSADAQRGAAVVIAAPDFDARPDAGPAPAASRAASAPAGLEGIQFGPLPGTAGEAEALTRILPGARVLTGPAATERAMKDLRGPDILHVATHGFFLTDEASSTVRLGSLEVGRAGDRALRRIPNPLLRSGLALAGANARGAGGEDGILTALEASGLDLRGTELVVLSACETGVGRVETGEGVFGIRRAFTTAGAESQVISLWKVADEPTRDLMVAYYERLMRGEGRSEALRAAQLELRERLPHPAFWASFIPSGSWAPLR